MKKIIKITESQLDSLTKRRINEVGAIELANILKQLPCTGESVKKLISDKLLDYGFTDVNVKFLGYGENRKILRYVVHTEGPIFIIDTMSNSEVQPPCMGVMDVIAYTKA